MKMKKTSTYILVMAFLSACSGGGREIHKEEVKAVSSEEVHLTPVQLEKALVTVGELAKLRRKP